MEPSLTFSRTTDSAVQWVQLLHALDQPDVPGWPLLTPMKIQMRKCEKCSLEFCSPVNHRRHFRVHRRSLNVNKGPLEIRDKLARFWDKLSVEQAKEIVSFSDVTLKEISASSIISALASSLRNPGVWALPQAYFKAGVSLLNIIQAKDTGLPMSSQELFDILDDASEKTFLCAGTAESLQVYIFDGETAKSSIEMKNLIASTSFLFEQQLVKAWVADQEVESLRCEKLLVQEEEAAQKRQAVLLEKKKQKKLRQKELKTKEQSLSDARGDSDHISDVEDRSISAEISGRLSQSDLNPYLADLSTQPDSYQHPTGEQLDGNTEMHMDFWSEDYYQGEPEVNGFHMANGKDYHPFARLQAFKSQSGGDRLGVHASPNFHNSRKPRPVHKVAPSDHRDLLNRTKVWTKKHKANGDESHNPPMLSNVSTLEIAKSKSEVLIGSIPVSLTDVTSQEQECQELDSCYKEPIDPTKRSGLESSLKATMAQVASKPASMSWRPVASGSIAKLTVDGNKDDYEANAGSEQPQSSPNKDRDAQNHSALSDGNTWCSLFSTAAAREFLKQRWKEAISSEHVKLSLSGSPAHNVAVLLQATGNLADTFT